MKKNNYITIITFLVICAFFAQKGFAENITEWSAEKQIEITGENEFKYIWLDEEVYRHVKHNLNDIRLIDESGNFIPYFVDNIYTKMEGVTQLFNLQLIDTKNMKDKELFDFQVNRNNTNKDVTINYMELDVRGQNYVKEINIYGSYDGVLWEFITKDKIYNIDNMNKTNLYFNSIKKYNFYRFEILNNIEGVKINDITGYKNDTNTYTSRYYKQKELKHSLENKNKSTYLYLNNFDRLHIHKINIETSDTFRRNYEIYLNGEEHSDYMGEIYNLNLKNLQTKNTEINLPNGTKNTELKIKINNGDDKPLNISRILVTYSVDKIIFKANQKANYKLLYKNDISEKPMYDIEKNKLYILNEKMDECKLGSIVVNNATAIDDEKIKKADNTEFYKVMFNILTGMVSVGLVIFIGIKLKKN